MDGTYNIEIVKCPTGKIVVLFEGHDDLLVCEGYHLTYSP